MRTTIYHNSRCSKSRECLTILNDFKEEVEVVNYLNQPFLSDDIERLLELLQVEPQDIIRRSEAVFKEHFADKKLSRSEWIEAIVKYPILLERPIIVKGNKAIIGRPPQKLLDFLSKE